MTYIYHSVLVSTAPSQEVVHLVDALVPESLVLHVRDGLGHSHDNELQELRRQDKVFFSPVEMTPGLLEPESDKKNRGYWVTAEVLLVYLHSCLLGVETPHQLAVDEGGEDLGDEAVGLVRVEGLQDAGHLLPSVLISAVELDLVDGLPRQVQPVLRLLQDLLHLFVVCGLLK